MEASSSGLRVAITGAAGSLGRQVVSRLRAAPEVEAIVALDRAPGPDAGPDFELHSADVRDKDIGRFFQGCDAVLHLAFIVERGSRDPVLTEDINVGGSRNVFEAAAAAGVPQIVYASSIASYGSHPDNDGVVLTEDAPRRGNEEFYYARHKAAVENWLDGFEAAHPELRIARLRPTIFLSETSPRGVAGLRLPFHVALPGASGRFQITHEGDVADAFVLALLKGAHGAYNVAVDDAGLNAREMGAAMGKPVFTLPRFLVSLYRLAWRFGLGDVDPVWIDFAGGRSLAGSNEKIKRELGWSPRFSTTADVLRHLSGRSPALSAPRSD